MSININKKNNNLIILGAGGQGKVCFEIAQKMNMWDEIFFYDNYKNQNVLNQRVITDFSKFENLSEYDFFIAIGDNLTRKNIYCDIQNDGLNIVNLIDKSADITSYCEVNGTGNVFMKKTIINTDCVIGSGNIFNTASIIEHDCQIGDFNHFSPSSVILGGVKIGSLNHLGASSIVLNNTLISNEIIVGANSFCNVNLLEKGTYLGSPCKLKSVK